jgi:sorting nexin-25
MTFSPEELKAKQIESCPSKSKVALVISSVVDDPVSKATHYVVQSTVVDPDGNERTVEQAYRYSVLLDFNETLIHAYGLIRILKLFPPKKLVGNHDGNFVQQRKDAIQKWMSEIIADEELVDDPKIRAFFQVQLTE